MRAEVTSFAIELLRAAIGQRYQDQYHYAVLLMLDALANGAKGPEVAQRDARRLMDNQDRISAIEAAAQNARDTLNFMADWDTRRNANAEDANPGAMTANELNECRLDIEDASKEARR